MVLAIIVNVGLTFAQIVGGIFSGSLSLIADALHNFSDAASLAIAAYARRIARRPSNAAMTFGYVRAEVVAALINYTTLIVIGLYLVYEAVMRFITPEPVEGWIVVGVAVVALVIDLATAFLTYAMSKESMNIRAAFVHNVADALGSVGVIVAGWVLITIVAGIADAMADQWEARLKALASQEFGIGHSTLEFASGEACCQGEDASIVGHPIRGASGERHRKTGHLH